MGLSGTEIYPRAATALSEVGLTKEAIRAARKIPRWPGVEKWPVWTETFHTVAARQAQDGDIDGAEQTALESRRQDVIGFVLAESAIGLANSELDPRPVITKAIRRAEETKTNMFTYGQQAIPTELWATIGRAQSVNGIGSKWAFDEAWKTATEPVRQYERGLAMIAIGEQRQLAEIDGGEALNQAVGIAEAIFTGPLEERENTARVFDYFYQQFLYVDIAKVGVAGGNFQLALKIADRLDDAGDKVEVMTAAAAEMGRRGLSQQAINALSPKEIEMVTQSDDKRVKQAVALFGIG